MAIGARIFDGQTLTLNLRLTSSGPASGQLQPAQRVLPAAQRAQPGRTGLYDYLAEDDGLCAGRRAGADGLRALLGPACEGGGGAPLRLRRRADERAGASAPSPSPPPQPPPATATAPSRPDPSARSHVVRARHACRCRCGGARCSRRGARRPSSWLNTRPSTCPTTPPHLPAWCLQAAQAAPYAPQIAASAAQRLAVAPVARLSPPQR